MAEDTTTANGEPGPVPLIIADDSNDTVVLEDDGAGAPAPNTIIVDGSSNTIVLEEDAGGGPAPNGGTAPNAPGLTVVVANRDPATGDLTLAAGKSVEGDGRVQIDGTDRVFEDQTAFEQFLADVHEKADAGVPFEDIIGNDVNAIPVVENGVAIGETLGGIEDGVAPGEVLDVGVAPPTGGSGASPEPGLSPDVNGGAPPAGSFGNQPGERADGSSDPDGPGDGNPSANGNVLGDGAFEDVNQNGIDDVLDRLRGIEVEPPEAVQPPPGDRHPGRDENGELLPGADGVVTLDDFNEINDRDGNGINDGVENPVDLGGRPDEEAPPLQPPPAVPPEANLPPVDPPPSEQAGDVVVDATPEPPAHPPAPPVVAEDPVLPGDGFAVVAEPAAEVVVDPPAHEAPAAAVKDPVLPGHGDAGIPEPTAEVLAHPVHAAPQVEPPQPPVAAEHPTATPVAHAPAEAASAAAEAYPAAQATIVASAAAALDTFDTGTAPSAVPAAYEPAPEHAGGAGAGEPVAPGGEATPPTTAAAGAYPTEEAASTANDTASGVAASAAAVAPLPETPLATDVFEPAAVAAASVAGKPDESGGGNLLERIFEKVKDVLFDSGDPEPSIVQLPVQAEQSASEVPAVPLSDTGGVAAIQFEDSTPAEDPNDDDAL